MPNEGVSLNQATITLFGIILTPMCGVIVALWVMLKGRLDRAEKQVDTLLPALTTMNESIRMNKEEIAKANNSLDQIHNELIRK